jgi:hypothetical protein
MSYATLAQLKTTLGITTTADDPLLQLYLDQAQVAVDNYCGQTFEAGANSTRYFHAVDDVHGRELWFDAPLCSINSVTNGDSTTVTTGDYVTLPFNAAPYYGLRIKGSSAQSWTYTDDPENAIAVSGKWAYSVTAPAAIGLATLQMASFLWNRRGTEGYTSVEVNSALVAQFAADPMPPHIAAILASYRRLL